MYHKNDQFGLREGVFQSLSKEVPRNSMDTKIVNQQKLSFGIFPTDLLYAKHYRGAFEGKC